MCVYHRFTYTNIVRNYNVFRVLTRIWGRLGLARHVHNATIRRTAVHDTTGLGRLRLVEVFEDILVDPAGVAPRVVLATLRVLRHTLLTDSRCLI